MLRQRRAVWLAATVAVVLASAVWLVVVARAVLTARTELRAGVAVVDRIRASERPTDLADGTLVAELTEARRHFAAARSRVDSAPLRVSRIVPVVGRQLRSAAALSAAAERIADVGIDSAGRVRVLSERTNLSPLERLDVVRALADIAQTTDARLAGVDLGPRLGLVPPLARARNQIADKLSSARDGLRRTAAGAGTVAGWLEGPRRYLVLVANNAEMRAGSGMFLSIAEVETENGRVRLGGTRSVTDVPVPGNAVTLEGELADRWGWLEPHREWRNLMVSPRFDVAAPLAAEMWVAAGNRPVDGVIALDPAALRGVLAATGPVQVDGRTITADNVLNEALHDQYLRFPALEERPERREALGRLAQAAFDALDTGAWEVPVLVGGLAAPVQGRHMMLWSRLETEQRGWHAAGVDGSLRPNSLLVSVLNRGGNKLDVFLKSSAQLSCGQADASGDRDCTVRLTLENTVPEGEPGYIVGPHPGSGAQAGEYLGIVAVSLPASAADGRIEGVDRLTVAGADGPTRVVGHQFSLPRGAKRQFVLRFRLPLELTVVRIEPSARLPNVSWRTANAEWLDVGPRSVTL